MKRTNKLGKIILFIFLFAIIFAIVTLCYGYYKKITLKAENPIATIEVEGYGTMTLELYPEFAPNTVAYYIAHANNGFYDGLTFHRILKGTVVQGGDPVGDGTGGASLIDLNEQYEDKDYSIKGEFYYNGFENNTLRHEEGVISMARSDYSYYGLTTEGYNSASSQFFIMTSAVNQYDGYYAAFGKVIEGLDILHKIENVELAKDEEGKETTEPSEAVKITSIKVDAKGFDYKLPKTQEPFDITTWFYNQFVTVK